MEQDEKKENTEEKQKIEQKIEQREEKIKNWLKDPYNLAFLGIMVFAFVIRFYYFFLTKNQPLWWDEAEYMSAAKSYAGYGYSAISGFRLPLFPMLMSFFFFTGLSYEPLMRFLGLFIPSLIVIFLAYLLLAKMYNKKIGIISAFILSVLWEHVFYSNRFHTENLSLIFEFLVIYLMFSLWQNGKSNKASKNLFLIGSILILSVFSVLSRPGNLIFVPAVFIFLVVYGIFSSKLSDRNKNLTILGLIIIIPIIFFLSLPIFARISFLSGYYHPNDPLGWKSLTVFNGFYLANSFPAILFFIVFLIGVIISIFNLFISYGQIKKLFLEKKEFSSDIFSFFIILSVLFSMVFMLRANSFEYRWFFPLLPGMLAFTSKGIFSIGDFVKSLFKIKYLSLIIVLAILILGGYPQVSYTTNLVKARLDSYQQVKDSGLWLKENSNKQDIIISASVTQHSYYSERKIEDFYVNGSNENETLFDEKINKLKPKYLVISVFEPGFTPQWAYDWPSRNNETVIPIKAYYLDKEQKQLALITYEIKYIIGYNKS